MTRALRATLCLWAAASIAGCATAAPTAARYAQSANVAHDWGGFRTLTAEHRVTVDAVAADGARQRRSLRGILAVERPGRFRLRALGPGGITLFDILYRDGKTDVISSIRDPAQGALGALLPSIAADLALVYDLAPRPNDRRYSVENGEIVARETGREARLGQPTASTAPGLPTPTRIWIDNTLGYHVEIEASGTRLDAPLDPAMFEASPTR